MTRTEESGRVGLLSVVNAPLLGHYIGALLERGVVIDSILFDSRRESARDLAIHEQRTAGRLPPKPLHAFDSHAIPCFFIRSHSSKVAAELVQERQIDLLLNAGTPRILGSEILSAPLLGILNIHPGLLPDFRGCSCVEWAIYLDRPVGNTVHFMTEGIDEGPILRRREVEVRRSDTYVDVRMRVFTEGIDLFAEETERVLEARLTPGDLERQGPGRHYDPIDDERFAEVTRKLERGEYSPEGGDS